MLQWLIDALKLLSGFLTPVLSKWLFGIVGTFLVSWGVENPEDVVYKIIGGLFSLFIAFLIELFQHKKAINTEVPKVEMK